jgi:hypothetical protein
MEASSSAMSALACSRGLLELHCFGRAPPTIECAQGERQSSPSVGGDARLDVPDALDELLYR